MDAKHAMEEMYETNLKQKSKGNKSSLSKSKISNKKNPFESQVKKIEKEW